ATSLYTGTYPIAASTKELTPEEWKIVKETCEVLKPFEEVTVEMSSESYVTCSKARGLQRIIAHKQRSLAYNHTVQELVNCLGAELDTRFRLIERVHELADATLLDPWFKKHAFVSERNAEDAVGRVVSELLKTM
ncbi:hypothetical protein QTP86_017429, partial [Hemibagrus guttatus]